MTELGLNQLVQLELADIVNSICEEENIKYTLLAGSIVAFKQCGGFAPFTGHLSVGLLYPAYLRFIEACKKRLYGTEYYIVDKQTCEQFEELMVRLAKRSNVVLADTRKGDEVYYDYFINIIPIYYAGNTLKELRNLKKQYAYYRKCASARKILCGTIHLKNCFKMAKRAYYHSRREKYTFEKIREQVIKYGEESTKYVFIPLMCTQKGISCLAETYSDMQEIKFEQHSYYLVRNMEQWIKGFYSEKEYNKIISLPFNKANVVGPEIMRRIQLIELEMLREFDRICRKYELKYVLGFGTLLGAVRHGGFIPWDDDIDVCMPYEDYVKFIELAPEELDKKRFFLRTQDTDKDCNLSFIQMKRNGTIYCRDKRESYDTHLGVFIDIFPMFNGSNCKILHNIQFRICKFYKTMIWAHMGAISEKKYYLRKYYLLLSKVSNKDAYKKYMKWATLFKKPTDKLAFLSVFRNPYNVAYTRKESLENTIEMNFEGFKFRVPSNYEDVLCSIYSDEYMRYPELRNRVAKHLPAVIEIGDLFKDMQIQQ